jgi:hypothetical protein
LQSDDGGLYFRSNPRSSSGDWNSLNGDLSISEFLSASYDPTTRIFVAGAQDNGVFMSDPALASSVTSSGILNGKNILSGDGGSTSIDPRNGSPRFYITNQYLGLAYAYSSTYNNPYAYVTSTSSASYSSTTGYMFNFDNVASIGSTPSPMQPLIVMNAVTPSRLVCYVDFQRV